mmetsp:Transcript_21413/g.50993  ORF Transcript_21413/g.50993 Transcript_21413/m.50993 type:complete len:317 (-) Transcript_21413:273-1223(-)|eukprot:CAMPEP_0197177632 /NCGR_PEP_ID=MMETSP1423-20130617/3173_1 /TAXON_ID=476441 /ORGANISM="Pseudo-nitzschia heimii, Strain UNC1101" /LENGTH=316 /DNA_ID=CAMNT_0042627211 /DNA_START=347 /DNA_END=1297 /DNA_ORIENTATION=-
MDISDDGDASSMAPSATRCEHTLLYVVQKCWHSGPTQHVPVDMLRLFHTQREAEEAAYHSAAAYHEAHAKPGRGGAVKTLLLPSYPSHNPQGSSYGFLACGGLFWVRAVRATVVVAGGGGNGICHSAAYAILTEGVIGGTGNRNSRRGTEVCDGRVFGGDAMARAIAEEAVDRVRRNLTNPSLAVEARTVPVGKPPEWLSSGAFASDWPLRAGVSSSAAAAETADDLPFGTVPKRAHALQTGSFGTWGRSVSRETMHDEDVVVAVAASMSSSDETAAATTTMIGGLPVVECPFEEPRAKRRRVVSVVEDGMEMMMT